MHHVTIGRVPTRLLSTAALFSAAALALPASAAIEVELEDLTASAEEVLAEGIAEDDDVRMLLLDFDTDANGDRIIHGQVVDTAYSGVGVNINVWHPSDRNLDFGLALNTANSIEADMRTGVINGAYHPSNTEFLNNVLITPRNAIDSNGDGILDIPDTAFERPNGVVTFSFDEAIYIAGSITVLDAEEEARPEFGVGVVEARLNDGTVLGTTVIPALGDNAVVTVPLPDVDQPFEQIRVVLAGSSGLDNLFVTNVPEPATAALLGLGGLAMLRRRSA
ncbi:MAG: PEP-CTERM sorting domain-containing protein [Planctomycetota bacterium]